VPPLGWRRMCCTTSGCWLVRRSSPVQVAPPFRDARLGPVRACAAAPAAPVRLMVGAGNWAGGIRGDVLGIRVRHRPRHQRWHKCPAGRQAADALRQSQQPPRLSGNAAYPGAQWPGQPIRAGDTRNLVFFGESNRGWTPPTRGPGRSCVLRGTSIPHGGGANAAPIAYETGGRELIADAFGSNVPDRMIEGNGRDAIVTLALPGA